jgi:hypothetical protein
MTIAPQLADKEPVAGPDAPADPQALEHRIREVVGALLDSLRAVVDSIDSSPTRPMVLARALGVHKNLAGRVLAAIRAGDLLAGAHHLPAPQGLGLFLSACARQRVPREKVLEAQKAADAFEVLIARDTGGRDALEAMIAAWMPEVRRQGERARKQSVYKAMSYLLGYQVDAKLAVTMVQPSAENPDTCDLLAVYGCRGLRRLRPGAPVTIAISGTRTDNGITRGKSCFEPLSGEHVAGQYVLKEFSTVPLPELILHEEGEVIRFMLGKGGLGPKGGVTLMFADIVRGAFRRYQDDASSEEASAAILSMPCQVLVRDVYLRDDVCPGAQPKLTTSMLRPGDPAPPGRSSNMIDRLELSETVQYLGFGTTGIHTEDIPDYAAMLNQVFDAAGWPKERFRGYRLRVQYPVPFMVYTIWFGLPRK